MAVRVAVWTLVALLVAGLAAAQPAPVTMTTTQKVLLTVTPTGGVIPEATLLVWSVEGDSATNRLGTFDCSVGGLACYYLPAKAGTHVVRVSLVIEGVRLDSALTITVTNPVPTAVSIVPGVPIPR